MTNIIVDAGTDAKIAKFQKRGIELIDLALLEPVEVWGEGGKEKDAKRESMRIVADEMGASVVVNAGAGKGGTGPLSKGLTPLMQSGGSRPVTSSATSSATSLHIQTPLAHTPISQHLSSQPMTPDQQYYTPPLTAISDIFPISRSISNTSTSNNPTPMPPASPAPMTSMMSPTALSAPGSGKRKLFNKLFNRKQNSSNLRSPGSGTTTYNPPDLEVSPSPTFASFALSPAPVTNRITSTAARMERSFGSRSDSTKRRSAAPSALIEPAPFSPTISEVASPGLGVDSMTSPIEQQTPTQRSVAAGAKTRDVSPPQSLSSNDKRRSQSRSSLVGTLSTNESADSHGGGVFAANEGFGVGGNGQALPRVVTTPAQAQSEIMMNLRQQQLQLRPPVLGIQPTFVTSSPFPSASSNHNLPSHFPQDGPSTMTETPDQLVGQRALMYVWLVRRWMKKKSSGLVGLSGLGDSAVGFLGGVVGNLKGEKEKEKGKEKVKDRRSHSVDYRPGSSNAGLAAVTAPLMYGGVEVRFEWKRAKTGKEKSGSRKKKSRRRRGRAGTIGGGAESDGEVETSIREGGRNDLDEQGSIRGGKTKERLKCEERKKYRMSTGSIKSITVDSETDGGELGTKKRNQYDDGEDSDPEDSETPWICTLKLRRGATLPVGGSKLNPAAGDAQPQPTVLQTEVLRIKVGTLSPTPHHPKVVAMLKVPFPLPDIEVERMGVVKRQGVTPPQSSTYNGLVLTAEEIKDVVCSTGLWVVVREGFGGVGRVSRKGDGWRIRA